MHVHDRCTVVNRQLVRAPRRGPTIIPQCTAPTAEFIPEMTDIKTVAITLNKTATLSGVASLTIWLCKYDFSWVKTIFINEGSEWVKYFSEH